MPSLDPRLRESLWTPYVQDVALACQSRVPLEDTALVLAVWARETIFGHCGPSFVVPPGQPIWMGRGDGGHGRGFPQIDDRGPFKYLIPAEGEDQDWPVKIQADCTCIVLATAREELADFRGTLSPQAWDEAVACRYNASLANVRWALRAGRDPNIMTTGKNYGRDVIALRDQLRAAFPVRFPRPGVVAERIA